VRSLEALKKVPTEGGDHDARRFRLRICQMTAPDSAALRDLLEGGDARDRAFVDANLRLAFARTSDARKRGELLELSSELQAAALGAHAELRAEIVNGAWRPEALRRLFDALPATERDHTVEEVLGIAYPPLEEAAAAPESIAYVPSGYDEIVHAFDATNLGEGARFLDLGSGLGKVVLLARLLTGASSRGVERDAELCERARAAATALALSDVCFEAIDALDLCMDGEEVVFMYLPFTGKTLERVLGRALGRTGGSSRLRYLCAGALDLRQYPELSRRGEPKSWLCVYACRAT
jgi:hypothetical protein